jgi:hypothetical protein
MTGFGEIPKSMEINTRNLDKAIHLAQMGGVTTVLLTGKGEPCLYPEQIYNFLCALEGRFPFIELQTNGLDIGRLAAGKEIRDNEQVYSKDYPELARSIEFLHDLGFSVRLCVMMQNGYVDSPGDVDVVIDWCEHVGVEQLTFRPIRKPEDDVVSTTSQYVAQNGLTADRERAIYSHIQRRGEKLLELAHGATVYDVDGQNVCISDCLTHSTDPNEIRQIIFYADGRLTYSWDKKGAILMGGRGK